MLRGVSSTDSQWEGEGTCPSQPSLRKGGHWHTAGKTSPTGGSISHRRGNAGQQEDQWASHKYELGSHLARGAVPLRIGDLESSCRGQITKENRIPGAREVRLESKAIAGHWPVHGPFSPSCCPPPEPGNSAPGSGHSANTKAAVPFLAFSPEGSAVPAPTGC